MPVKGLIFPVLFFSFICRLAAQGPISGFMTGRGHTDVAVSYTYEHFDRYYFGDELQTSPTTTRSANFFLEHGFSDTLGLVFAAPYKWIDEVNRGLQDATLALKYRNSRQEHDWGRSSFITSVGLSFPLSNYPVDTESPIGIKAAAFQTRILTQFQWNSGIFVMMKTGLDFRLIPSALTSIPGLLRIGWGGRKWYYDGWLEVYHTFNPQADVQIFGGNGSQWWRLGGTVYYALTPGLGVVFNAAHFLSGVNIGKATQVTAGVVLKVNWQAPFKNGS